MRALPQARCAHTLSLSLFLSPSLSLSLSLSLSVCICVCICHARAPLVLDLGGCGARRRGHDAPHACGRATLAACACRAATRDPVPHASPTLVQPQPIAHSLSSLTPRSCTPTCHSTLLQLQPIGCISGKNVIVRAPGFDEVRRTVRMLGMSPSPVHPLKGCTVLQKALRPYCHPTQPRPSPRPSLFSECKA